jgi:hypothetical protein
MHELAHLARQRQVAACRRDAADSDALLAATLKRALVALALSDGISFDAADQMMRELQLEMA